MTRAVRIYIFFVVSMTVFAAGLMATKVAPAARRWRSVGLSRGQGILIRTPNRPALDVGRAAENRRLTNIAPFATVTVSSAADERDGGVADGVLDAREWTSRPQTAGTWILLDWDKPAMISEVDLYDRASPDDNILAGVLCFSDGSVIAVGPLPEDGSPAKIKFRPKAVEWVKFQVHAAQGSDPGLAEIMVRGVLSPWAAAPGSLPN